MKYRALLIILAMLCIPLSVPVLAQSGDATEDPSAGWPVEQHCVNITPPPAGWTFDGTILMLGDYGIHGYQAGWETPHVLVFLHKSNAVRGGALSPDGNWYAYPWGEFFITETYNAITSVSELRVHSTRDAREYRVALRAQGYQSAYDKAVWLDNEHVLFQNMDYENPDTAGLIRITPVSGTIETWTLLANAVTSLPEYLYPAPDWKAFVAPYYGYVRSGSTVNYEGNWGLYSFEDNAFARTADIPLGEAYLPSALAWSPDSTQFAAYTDNNILALFDRNGTITQTIFTFSGEGEAVGLDSLQWSSDGRYVTFDLIQDSHYEPGEDLRYVTARSAKPGSNHIMIADLQEQKIIDTCLPVGWGVAWSPETNHLAFVGPGEGQVPLQVFDVNSWEAHTVAYQGVSYPYAEYHDDRVMIGWRAD
ncbi:hypothetical protein [Aggregatilinea lenta]|uniref:hypothetical protein n=1 Tax=Aggregatilinea lenta TaxID=913108 RepID=UPI000E5AB809|nr:hypothetical protein [Aggregatilinea lenta]